MDKIITEKNNFSNNLKLYSNSYPNYSNNQILTQDSIPQSQESIPQSIPQTNIIRYLIIIVILGFLGINLFAYLGNIIEYFKNTFGNLFNKIIKITGLTIGETAKTAIDVTTETAKLGIDTTAGTLTTSINTLQKTLDGNHIRNYIDSNKQTIEKAIDNAEQNIDEIIEHKPNEYAVRKNNNKIEGHSGFCYIGEYKGFRSCASITESDKCLSGDIFPTREICINPNLRQ